MSFGNHVGGGVDAGAALAMALGHGGLAVNVVGVQRAGAVSARGIVLLLPLPPDGGPGTVCHGG